MSETKHVRVILINGQKIDVEHEGSAESFIKASLWLAHLRMIQRLVNGVCRSTQYYMQANFDLAN